VFHGTFPFSMDDKGRLKMPEDFARHLRGSELFTTISQDGQSLWVLPPGEWEKLMGRMRGDSILDTSAEDLREWFAGACHSLKLDSGDRLTLPAVLRAEAGITGRDIAIVGQIGYVAIWDRARWEERRRQIAERQAQLRAAVPRAPLPPTP